MAKKQKTAIQQNVTDEGSVLDLSGIDNTLTDRAKRFVFWFCFPGTDCFQHKKRAAIRAGYAKKNAVSSGYKLCQNPTVKKEIEKLSGAYISEGIDVAFRKYINTLENRAFYDPADFISGGTFKPIEEIAPEKRVCLEQPILDMREGRVVAYVFGNRRAAMAEIKELHEKAHPVNADDEADPEETIRVMAEFAQLEFVRERRRKKDEISKAAGFMKDDTEGRFIHEL